MTGIRLRPVAASDLDTFFEHQCDPVALRVGTLTSRGRAEFNTHWARILADPLGILRTVERAAFSVELTVDRMLAIYRNYRSRGVD